MIMSNAHWGRMELAEMADNSVIVKADALVNAGKAHWEDDPWINNVAGLVENGTNNAYIIVYRARGDFETSDTFEAMPIPASK